MPYKSWRSLPVDEPCMRRWLEGLAARTAIHYGVRLLAYRDWCREKGGWPSAGEMLEEYRGLSRLEDQFRHVDVLKKFIGEVGVGVADRRLYWFAVRSFYEFHRLPLPEISRSERQRLFRVSERDKQRALEVEPLRLEDVRQLVFNARFPYKAAIMMMFQGALGRAEFTQFNTANWRRLVEVLDRPGPAKIDLYRSKASRTKVQKYYTFIGEDAKTLIKQWLEIRPEVDVDALFVVYSRRLRQWRPLRGDVVGDRITKIGKRLKLIKPSSLGRYRVHAHEFRDLFKSLATLSGVNAVASEYFLGHDIDRLGYDKSPEYDVEWFRNEYAKLEPRLNIISNPLGRTDVKVELEELETRQRRERDLLLKKIMRLEKERMMAAERVKRLEDRLTETIKLIKREAARKNNPNNSQKVVDVEELPNHLSHGWRAVLTLPDGRIVVERA